MQIIRTVALIIVTAILVAFIAMNWTRAVINLWPQGDGTYVHLECPVGLIAILFFFLGMSPVWLYSRAVRWRLGRRIAALENMLVHGSMQDTHATPERVIAPGDISPSEPTSRI